MLHSRVEMLESIKYNIEHVVQFNKHDNTSIIEKEFSRRVRGVFNRFS